MKRNFRLLPPSARTPKRNLLKKDLNQRATPWGRPYNSASRRGNPMWLPVFFNNMKRNFRPLPPSARTPKGNLLKKGLNRRATPWGRPYNSASRRGNPMGLPVFFNNMKRNFRSLPPSARMPKGNLLKKGLNRRATPWGRPYNNASRRGNPMWLPMFFNKMGWSHGQI